ncbi:putative nitrite reductase [Violaceomyces palustris]|uniref:Nitrite reductase n=1 Tax=Violaceomyces palustris TaxID=1673888 RepID=A0ACD0NTY5_9BASI|nr:putative nitrite reductase [Violaceomyces palustris]
MDPKTTATPSSSPGWQTPYSQTSEKGTDSDSLLEETANNSSSDGDSLRGAKASGDASPTKRRNRIVVVGLGMVGISFIEKLLKYDLEGGWDLWEVLVIGEEPHLAYNRVGLTQYFKSRSLQDLLLNPQEWYSSHAKGKLRYITQQRVTSIHDESKTVTTSDGTSYQYDKLVLSTGSRAALPPYMPWEKFTLLRGSFIYREIQDLDSMIQFSERKSASLLLRSQQGQEVGSSRNCRGVRAAVVGGGLLGLEAAKALLDLEGVEQVFIIERNDWVLSRQLDKEGGELVLEKVRALGVKVLVRTSVGKIVSARLQEEDRQEQDVEEEEEEEELTGVDLIVKDGKGGVEQQHLELDMIVFAVGIKARDELSESNAAIKVSPRGGGFEIDQRLNTSLPDVYAIGECASFKGETYGLIAPGVEMAEVLAFNLTEGHHHALKEFTVPDLSTKLKLMGVDVASFGDYFADKGKLTRTIPGSSSRKSKGRAQEEDPRDLVKSLTYRDPFSDVYKKYIFTKDGKYLLGGMMVGDVKDYVKLVTMVNKCLPMEKPPSELIIGAKKEGEEEGSDLPDEAQICSCHNVTKGDVIKCVVKDGSRSFGEIKSKTKCATGCGGCVPLATSIFNEAMKKAGAEVSNSLCIHFRNTRQEIYQIVKFKKLKDFNSVMSEIGNRPDSLGCEVCRPAVGSILSSLFNEWIMKPEMRQTQDTNDRYLANVQRDGTYSVVPRLPAGEVTPQGLKVIGEIAEEFNLYTKITGGQRIDMFGAKKQDLPVIWEKLVKNGFESGHAYGKSLRTVKSCVGSTWCRYGVGDSVGLAVELEQRYKSIRAPHKFKGGVSGCIRECAEAQGKDFGLIATPSGWNVYLGGNGGSKPRHAELIAENVTRREAIKILDRFIIFYIRSADRLQRTARWIEAYPGGIKGLKEVIVEDKLGICKELEQEMEILVGTYHCEWAEVVKDEERRKAFRQFVNTEENQDMSERIVERDQSRPADWPTKDEPLRFSRKEIAKGCQWEWRYVCKGSDFAENETLPSSVTIKYGDVQIAIWKIPGRGLRASQNMCPHKRAFVLADGLIGEDEQGREYVSCPLHKRNYLLTPNVEEGGGTCNDGDYQIATFEAKQDEEGKVYLKLPPTEDLDAVLSTTKWMLRKAREESDMISGGEGKSGIEIAGVHDGIFLDTTTEEEDVEPAIQGAKAKKQQHSCGGAELEW